MGSCVSVHKDSESAMKFRPFFGSKNDKLVIPSPIKDKPTTDLQLKSVNSFPDFGSKEETFFDSQAWLDSDCEDDFLSVNGDFTPSRGNTPVHPSLAGNLEGDKAAPTSLQQSPPQEKKKRLSELFSESLRNEQEQVNEQNAADNQNDTSTKMETAFTSDRLPPRSTPGTPYASVCYSERTPNEEYVKSSKPSQCCLPRLLSSRSFSERRKRMSPARTVG
ncbi:uncharacterized protein At3g27210 [Lycium ferocissimum]|uniref:uncharacterized protein At3g27210 n=1 Tax=Lycium ferocissimum TaxID=112874 RepID=UPI002814CC46|nr:uncharacterized protein At3g27210 [Lycium ferocissimum]